MNHDLDRLPTTSPVSVYHPRDAMYATDLVTVAIAELHLFDALEGGAREVEDLLEALDVRPRPGDVLLTLLVAMGYLERVETRVRLSEVAREHLLSSSPWYLGPYYATLRMRPLVQELLGTLRSDALALQRKKKPWIEAMKDEEYARSFTGEMDCRGVTLGPAMARAFDFSPYRHVLDLGGGSGIYTCALLAHYPEMRGTVYERAPVDAIARRSSDERGLGDRIDIQTGDFFADDWPEADLHLVSNVLHDWGEAAVRQLLERSFAALPTGGRIAIHDAHINREKTGPLHVAQYSALLMHFTEGKCYSVGEMEAWLEGAGFVEVEYRKGLAHRSLVTARRA